MRLQEIERSELIALMSARRPAGQLFIPAAALAMQQRYHFQVLPSVDDISGDVLEFKHGVFNDVAFDFSMYRDGIIVKSASDTSFLEDVLDDILAWAKKDLGIIETDLPPKERHFVSNIIFTGDFEFQERIPTFAPIALQLKSRLAKYGFKNSIFEWNEISLAVDPGSYPGRKPVSFTIARRANLPFASKVYFSSAPLRTADHLKLLESLEVGHAE